MRTPRGGPEGPGVDPGFLGFYVKNLEKSSERHIYMPLYPIFDNFCQFLGILENSLARRVLATGARNETYSAFIHGLRSLARAVIINTRRI